jgi:hypothetical protein
MLSFWFICSLCLKDYEFPKDLSSVVWGGGAIKAAGSPQKSP